MCKVLGLDLQKSENPGFEAGDVFQINLTQETERLRSLIINFKPDVVLMLDFLEHLTQPDIFFDTVLEVLPLNTKVIISLPNIANFSILLRLCEDQFNYVESGLLDKTHVHFFTVSTFLSFLSKRPFQVQDLSHICLPMASQEWKSSLPNAIQDDLIGLFSQHNPYVNSYQFCISGRKTLFPEKSLLGVTDSIFTDHLSVVLCFFEDTSIEMLTRSLVSLASSEYDLLEVIIVGQNVSLETSDKIKQLLTVQSWSKKVLVRFEVVKTEERCSRAKLINIGISFATGKYLAFLDYGDVIYPGGYAVLIDKLKNSSAAIAVGGCQRVSIDSVQNANSNSFNVKSRPWGISQVDILQDNFVPMSSYVVDRTRCDANLLNFDTNLTSLDNYAFLLKVAVTKEINFELIDFPVCDCKMKQDSTNFESVENEQIELLKSKLYTVSSVKKIGDLYREVDNLRVEYHREHAARIRFEAELNRFSVKLARRLIYFFERIPYLKSSILGILRAINLIK